MAKLNHYYYFFVLSLLCHVGILLLFMHTISSSAVKLPIASLAAYLQPSSPQKQKSIVRIKERSDLSAKLRQNKIDKLLLTHTRSHANTSHKLNEQPSQQFATSISQQENHDVLLKILHTAIAAKQNYPESAQLLNQGGRVKISFMLLPSGHINNIRVSKSSGFNDLDTAAIEAVQAISPIVEAAHYLQQADHFMVEVVFE